jgi:hypothetical protein
MTEQQPAPAETVDSCPPTDAERTERFVAAVNALGAVTREYLDSIGPLLANLARDFSRVLDGVAKAIGETDRDDLVLSDSDEVQDAMQHPTENEVAYLKRANEAMRRAGDAGRGRRP